MGKPKEIDFHRCTSGIDFEEWVKTLLIDLRMTANRVGKNDGGVDVVAVAQVSETEKYRFYIQCKYYNKPLGKAPIQEVFTGTAHCREYGRPVVVTNNVVTFEARRYAKDLGVEIISEPEWAEFERIVADGKVDNPNQHKGLFGIMIASLLNSRDYLNNALPIEDEEKAKSKKELKFQILTEFDEAEECVKEAAYLQQKAVQFQQRALDIQKRALLRNLTYD